MLGNNNNRIERTGFLSGPIPPTSVVTTIIELKAVGHVAERYVGVA